jgi:hypothetical protein
VCVCWFLTSLQADAVDSSVKSAEQKARERLVVRFGDRWVDLTGWRSKHPAGPQWIDAFNGLDATEV